MRWSTRSLVTLVLAVVALAVSPAGSRAQERRHTSQEAIAEIADRLIEADADDAALLAHLVSRGLLAEGLRSRSATERDTQRAWLGRALATVLADQGFAPRDEGAPFPSPQASQYARDVSLVFDRQLHGLRSTPTAAEPDPFEAFAIRDSHEPTDPPPAPAEMRFEALLRVESARTKNLGDPDDDRAIRAWFLAAVDDAHLPSDIRMRAVVAFAKHRTRTAPGEAAGRAASPAPRVAADDRATAEDALRMIRAISKTRGAPAEAYAALASTGAPAAARFLTEVAFGARLRIDGRAASHADAALCALEAERPVLVADARTALLRSVRTYEAAAEPLRHSTGAADGTGWSARRGRDTAQHMIYGPYVTDLAPRRHVARFRFRIDAVDDAPVSTEILRLEVTSPEAERGGVPITTRLVKIRQAPVGTWQEFDVERVPDPAPMQTEFRVWWPGNCDVTVDRIEILTVPDAAAEIDAAERAQEPTVSPRNVARPHAARAILDAAFEAHGAAYDRLAGLLLADLDGARAALDALILAHGRHDVHLANSRLRLIGILRRRVDCAPEFARLHAAHDDAMAWYESRRDRSHPDDHVRADFGPVHRRDLEAGRILIAIAPDAGSVSTRGSAQVQPILPASALWRDVFAEVWLTGARPAPLPDRTDLAAPPADIELPGGGRRVLPFSTVGHRRLHALLQLARMDPVACRADLAELASDASATSLERAAAARALAAIR